MLQGDSLSVFTSERFNLETINPSQWYFQHLSNSCPLGYGDINHVISDSDTFHYSQRSTKETGGRRKNKAKQNQSRRGRIFES